MPVSGGDERKVPAAVFGAAFTVAADGLYFAGPPGTGGGSLIQFLSFASGKTTTLAKTQRPVEWGMSVSADGRHLLYTQSDVTGSDLMLVENFR
jgi:hypothetical protein